MEDTKKLFRTLLVFFFLSIFNIYAVRNIYTYIYFPVSEECKKTQKVEIYLEDLKNRLIEIRKQQEDVVRNSLDIIKEIDKVSSKLTWNKNESGVAEDHISKIQHLIQELEASYKGKEIQRIPKLSTYQKQDMQKIIENFENMTKNDVNKGRDSSEKLDAFQGKLDNTFQKKSGIKKDNIQDKINKFSKIQLKNDTPTTSEKFHDNLDNINVNLNRKKSLCEENVDHDCYSYYASCSSSIESFQKFNAFDIKSDNAISKCSSSFTDWDGDKKQSDLDLKNTN